MLAPLHSLCCGCDFAAAVARINALFLSWGKQNANAGHVGYEDQKSKALMKDALAVLHWRRLSEAPCSPAAPGDVQWEWDLPSFFLEKTPQPAEQRIFLGRFKMAGTSTWGFSHDKEVGVWWCERCLWNTWEADRTGKGNMFAYSTVFWGVICFFMATV